jgi:hypothetical protein
MDALNGFLAHLNQKTAATQDSLAHRRRVGLPQIAMSKPMRAKMAIQTITKDAWNEIVEMSAVYGGSTNDEDNSFAKTTPSGTVKLQIANKELHGAYKPGDVFYVDFTPVPKT